MRAEVVCHLLVVGELACAKLRNRDEVLSLLSALPAGKAAGPREILLFLDREKLHGRGLGWVDIHLLASARLMGTPLWTMDRALANAAEELGLSFAQVR